VLWLDEGYETGKFLSYFLNLTNGNLEITVYKICENFSSAFMCFESDLLTKIHTED